jgi:chemotaxis protein MotB
MWVMTFADLMSLLLAFFVLLFSFSEMDAQKYKQVAGSMKEAFGVQREVKVKDPPKGVNVIAREFSPGRTEPTPMNQVKQSTMDDFHQFPLLAPQVLDPAEEEEIEEEAEKIREALKEEIEEGLIEVETEGRKIIIRIREKGSFPSGSAELIRPFRKVIDKMVEALRATRGTIVVAGHTDNRPIHTARFRSNWELASSRAVTVIHELTRSGHIDQKRFQIAAFGDTRPLASNDTPEGRAQNRRVEVTLIYGRDLEKNEAVPEASKTTAQGAPTKPTRPEVKEDVRN